MGNKKAKFVRRQVSLYGISEADYKKFEEEAEKHGRSTGQQVAILIHGYVNGEFVTGEDMQKFMREAAAKGLDLSVLLGKKKR